MAGLLACAWTRAAVIFFSTEERVLVFVLGDRESASRSTMWKEGVREVSRPYLCVSTIGPWADWILLCLRELKLFHVWAPTAALRSSSFQKARSRIQLTRTTEVASEASLRAEMANRDVSQLALQPRVLVRRVRDCVGGRARYGSRAEGVRLRCDEDILMVYIEVLVVFCPV